MTKNCHFLLLLLRTHQLVDANGVLHMLSSVPSCLHLVADRPHLLVGMFHPLVGITGVPNSLAGGSDLLAGVPHLLLIKFRTYNIHSQTGNSALELS